MAEIKTAKRLTGGIIAIVALAVCLCITTFALVYASVSVENNLFHTGKVKINLNDGKPVSPIFTIKNNTFDISKQAGDDTTKNMAINIGMGENPKLPFTLIDEGNTISTNTAALYTASLTGGSNWYKETSGMKVLDGNGNNKVITALVWKTTTGETFELKTVG